jgi:aminopeptidase N
MVAGPVLMKDPVPTALLGHEIAHFWTLGAAGPAANFLSEGWAVWAESAVLESRFGAETAKKFWEYRASIYFFTYDSKASLLEDENNGGVAYVKGAWLFHMLEEAMGKIGFQKAVAEYSSRSLAHPAGWELLAECAQHYAPPDFDARSFLLPWLTEKRAPHLTAQIDGATVTIHQEPSVFELPLVLDASTARGPERQRVWIKGPETVVTFSGSVSGVKLDPDGSLLLRP